MTLKIDCAVCSGTVRCKLRSTVVGFCRQTFFQPEAKRPQQELWVTPSSPFSRVNLITHFLSLIFTQATEKIFCFLHDVSYIETLISCLVQSFSQFSIIGNTLVRLFKKLFPDFGQVVQPRWRTIVLH